jgi:two-component system, NtrC family, C4-dicarboxylate transport response regulator DctD
MLSPRGEGSPPQTLCCPLNRHGSMTTDIILVEDEPHLRAATVQGLQIAGFSVCGLAHAEEALHRIGPDWPGVVITDIKMPGMSGLELMARVLEIDPEIPVILVTGHGDIPMAVAAMRSGAYEFLEKPFATEILTEAASRALEKRHLVLENRSLRAALANRSGLEQTLIGRTQGAQRLRSQVLAFAATDADVLILGETGTGKELVARSLHAHSPRASGRFVPLNCGALPESVIESELFGHEAGAFTGAAKSRVGKLEYASGGTVFLDEIESMPLKLQIKLLRVLQDRVVVRLGSNVEQAIDVRVISGAKEDLRRASLKGTFREDLYYRLNVLKLDIPPLRERREDIPLLFQHFVDAAARRFKQEAPPVGPSLMAGLLAYAWPGNVRELQNMAMRFALRLDLELGLGLEIDRRPGVGPGETPPPLADQLAGVERRIIAETLERTGHSMKATYEALGVSRKTLYDKMKRYGLGDPERGDG